jgi:3-methyladenine DNA glycosylase AlkD
MRKATLAAAGATAIDHDVLVATARELWDDVHEHRSAAVELLAAHTDLLTPADLPFLEDLLRTAGTWALVDGLAPHVVGPIVEAHPDAATTLDRWSTDGDFWVQRAALLALLVPLRRGDGDWDRFTRYADALLDEREFFLRKAIGWILRDTSKLRPDLVHQWCLPRAARMSGVTYREVVKHLTPEQQQELAVARQP